MHVLVIGGTRFVGRLLTYRLIAARHRVTLFNRGTMTDPFGDRVERLVGDRTTPDFERLLASRTFDAVVDFAAYVGSDVQRSIDLFSGRIGHYVFISTGQVYLVRAAAPVPAREEDYHGATIPEPSDPHDRDDFSYGIGKRACEDALAAAPDFPSTRLRIPMVNGERDHHRRIESYLHRLLDGHELVVPDGGTRPMRHVYGDDVARTIVALLGAPPATSEAFNLAQDETPTLVEVLSMLAELLGARPVLLGVPSRALLEGGVEEITEVSPFSGKWMSFLDPSKAKARLGFRATPLHEQLGRIVASFLAHPPPHPPDGYLRYRSKELAIARAQLSQEPSKNGPPG